MKFVEADTIYIPWEKKNIENYDILSDIDPSRKHLLQYSFNVIFY